MKRVVSITAAILIGLYLIGAGLVKFHVIRLDGPGIFYRKDFEAVVARVRELGIKVGEERQLRLDDFGDPNSLRFTQPGEVFYRGARVGLVWATRDADGALAVVIETRDNGRAGEYGFAFSEKPLMAKPFGDGWYRIDVPGLNIVQPDMQIDEHWWRVLYNLD